MGRIALATCFVTAGVAGLAGLASSEQAPDTLTPPPAFDPRVYDIVGAVSAERIEADIRPLVRFGTRHTLSEIESDTRGIGAARRWIKAELDRISRPRRSAGTLSPRPTFLTWPAIPCTGV